MSSNSGATIVEQEAPSRTAPLQPGGRRSAGYWVSTWLPVLIGIAVILIESTPWLGADYTSAPLRRFFEAIFGPIADPRWDKVHHLIRKTGHFVGYGIIGVAWLRAWWRTLPRSRYLQDAALSLIGTGMLAAWDEWHQSLLPNRTSSPWDVLLDCCGAMCLCVVTYLVARLLQPQRLVRS